jgi:hypothetical protein
MSREQAKKFVNIGIDTLNSIQELGRGLRSPSYKLIDGVIKHFEVLKAYADGADVAVLGEKWIDVDYPNFYVEDKYCIVKPKPHPVFGFAMIEAPEHGSWYWYLEEDITYYITWDSDRYDCARLKAANVFGTKELAQMQLAWFDERLLRVRKEQSNHD